MIDFEHVSKEYKKGGKLAIMAGAGPMGLGALTYALHRDVRPSMVVVTDVNEDRLARAEALFPPAEVKEKDGIDLHFVNTGKMENPAAELREMTGGTGFDDVFCYAPVAAVVELCSAVLGRDGCLNFFAGPTDKQFSAKMNFYDVHYNSTHVMGTTGGNTGSSEDDTPGKLPPTPAEGSATIPVALPDSADTAHVVIYVDGVIQYDDTPSTSQGSIAVTVQSTAGDHEVTVSVDGSSTTQTYSFN